MKRFLLPYALLCIGHFALCPELLFLEIRCRCSIRRILFNQSCFWQFLPSCDSQVKNGPVPLSFRMKSFLQLHPGENIMIHVQDAHMRLRWVHATCSFKSTHFLKRYPKTPGFLLSQLTQENIINHLHEIKCPPWF